MHTELWRSDVLCPEHMKLSSAGWPELKAGLPVMKGSKMSCYFSGALALLKVLAGSCSVLGVAPPYRRWPMARTWYLCVESWAVTARTKPHHGGRIPGGSRGWGVWGGLEGGAGGVFFPLQWGSWLWHWGLELSFRQCWDSSSSFLARGGWWGGDPFFCLHPPPDAAFYYSAGAYVGLSQLFGHASWFQKFVYFEALEQHDLSSGEAVWIPAHFSWGSLCLPWTALSDSLSVDILEGVSDTATADSSSDKVLPKPQEQRWELSLGQSQEEGICVPISSSLRHYPWHQEQCSKVEAAHFAPKTDWARNQSSKQSHAPQRNAWVVFAVVCSRGAPQLPSEVTEPSWV